MIKNRAYNYRTHYDHVGAQHIHKTNGSVFF